MTRVTVIVYFGPVPTFFCMALGEDHHVSTLLRVVALFRLNLRFFGLFVISSFFLVSPTHIVNSRLSGWTIIYHEVFFRLKICAVFFCFVVNTHGHRGATKLGQIIRTKLHTLGGHGRYQKTYYMKVICHPYLPKAQQHTG